MLSTRKRYVWNPAETFLSRRMPNRASLSYDLDRVADRLLRSITSNSLKSSRAVLSASRPHARQIQ